MSASSSKPPKAFAVQNPGDDQVTSVGIHVTKESGIQVTKESDPSSSSAAEVEWRNDGGPPEDTNTPSYTDLDEWLKECISASDHAHFKSQVPPGYDKQKVWVANRSAMYFLRFTVWVESFDGWLSCDITHVDH